MCCIGVGVGAGAEDNVIELLSAVALGQCVPLLQTTLSLGDIGLGSNNDDVRVGVGACVGGGVCVGRIVVEPLTLRQADAPRLCGLQAFRGIACRRVSVEM